MEENMRRPLICGVSPDQDSEIQALLRRKPSFLARWTPHNVAFQMAVRTGSRERTTWTFLNFCRNPMI